MSLSVGGLAMLFCLAAIVQEWVLFLGKFGAPNPSLGHATPYNPARWIVRKPSHILTLSGVSQKFL
jgi:hypothetical protein